MSINGLTMPTMTALDGGLWQLAFDWSVPFKLPDGRRGRVMVYAGLVTDGASVPRMAWFLAGHPMESPRIVAALAHDWLYASHATDRKTADEIYAAILRAVGRASWRVAVEYAALRAFGASAWREHDLEAQYIRDEGRLDWDSTNSFGRVAEGPVNDYEPILMS